MAYNQTGIGTIHFRRQHNNPCGGMEQLSGPRATGRGTGREVIAAQEQKDYKRKQTNKFKT